MGSPRLLALFTIIAILVNLALPLAPVVPAKALTLADVDRAIQEGIDWVIRSIAFLDIYGYKAVIRDHPSIPITLEWNGEYFTAGGFLDPGDRDYRVELVDVLPSGIIARYYFNLDHDYSGPEPDYDVVIQATLTNIDNTTDSLSLYVEKCDVDNVKLYLGSYPVKLSATIYEGWSKTITVKYTDKWYYSSRYVVRHSTIIAAWLLEDEGYTGYAFSLKNYWQSLGFVYDVYAPLFNRSNNYPDDFFDNYTATWLGNGYDAHIWVREPPSEYDEGRFLYPYKSRMYIFNEVNSIEEGVNGWKDMPLHMLLRAVHLLNKYGVQRAGEARELIKEALFEGGWDGFGLHQGILDSAYILTGKERGGYKFVYEYKGYPIYLTAALLIALVRYYQVTGEDHIDNYNILFMADRLAGILVRAQWIHEHETPWGPLRLAIFRGGWPACYHMGSIVVAPSAWGIIDTATAGLDAVAGGLARMGINVGTGLLPMPSEFPLAIVNSESTILAVQALKIYRQLGRIPYDPTMLYVGLHGEFVEGGGGGSSFGVGKTLDQGRYIMCWVTSGYPIEESYYQYAKYRLDAIDDGNYNLTLIFTMKYSITEIGSGDITLIVKVINETDEIIRYYEQKLVSCGWFSTKSGTMTKVFHFDLGEMTKGTYYVEVGFKTRAYLKSVKVWPAIIERVILVPENKIEVLAHGGSGTHTEYMVGDWYYLKAYAETRTLSFPPVFKSRSVSWYKIKFTVYTPGEYYLCFPLDWTGSYLTEDNTGVIAKYYVTIYDEEGNIVKQFSDTIIEKNGYGSGDFEGPSACLLLVTNMTQQTYIIEVKLEVIATSFQYGSDAWINMYYNKYFAFEFIPSLFHPYYG